VLITTLMNVDGRRVHVTSIEKLLVYRLAHAMSTITSGSRWINLPRDKHLLFPERMKRIIPLHVSERRNAST